MDRNVASGAVGQASARGSAYNDDDGYDDDTNGRHVNENLNKYKYFKYIQVCIR